MDKKGFVASVGYGYAAMTLKTKATYAKKAKKALLQALHQTLAPDTNTKTSLFLLPLKAAS